MIKVSLWPSFIAALILHGLLIAWYFHKVDTTTIQLSGQQGSSLTFGLDNGAYQSLLQQQEKALQKQATTPVNQQKLSQKKPNMPKPNKQKPKQKKTVKANIKPKPINKTLSESTVQPKPNADIALKEPHNQQKQAQATQATSLETSTTDSAHAAVTSEKQSFSENNSNAQRNTAAEASQASGNTQGNQQSSPRGNGNSGKAIGKQGPIAMNDETKAYIRQLMQHLQRFKHYPKALKKAHIEGTPVVSFTINQQGEITHTAIKKRSQHQALDQAAINVFLQANPLPAIPASLRRDSLSMSLPIKFNLIND